MDLEHTLEFSTPITGIAVDQRDRGTAVLRVSRSGQVPLYVLANEGRLDDVRETTFEGTNGRQWLTIRFLGLTATVDRTEIVISQDGREIHRLTGHTTPITTLMLCPTTEEPLLVSGSEGGSIRLWDPRTGEQLQQSEATRVSVLAVYLGRDGLPRIASG